MAYVGRLVTPTGALALGDADHETTFPAPAPACRVRVWASDADQPERVWIDVSPSG
jgi:hypothetical protein